MIYFLLFLLEIILLFFLSKKLINSLARIFYRITNSHRIVVNILAVIFLPGTIVHEMAHMLTAGLMLVHVGEMNFLPEVQEDGVKLGSVQIGKTDPFRMMLIGVAPVIVGLLSILLIVYLLFSSNNILWWQAILGSYLVFEVGNTMFSSRRDLEGVISFALALVLGISIFLGGVFLINQNIFQNFLSFITNLNLVHVYNFFKMSSLYLLFPVALDTIIILLTIPFTKR